MRRREFIAALGAMAAFPASVRAQQGAVPVIGFLHAQPFSLAQHHLAAFRKALNEMGFVEGQTLRIEYRTADGDYSKLPALAAELVSQRVAVIATTGGTPVARVAVASTKTIPVVF